MPTQLTLYNAALRLLGERSLAAIDEDRKPRHLLDDVWNADLIDFVLEQGQWNFAMRAVQLTPSTTSIPAFGHVHAYDKPNDWIRTSGVCEDEFFKVPLLEYLEETGFWFAEIDPIYVRYISNSASYGSDLTRWPSTFTKYVEAYLASEIAYAITQSDAKLKVALALAQRRLIDARSKDAMNEATAFPPPGKWNKSRATRSTNDRGKRSRLIG